ncbi:hypothetical protein CR513_10054, partial [Mucuna pruriens]
MTNPKRKDWNRLLEDSLWAHRTAYQLHWGCIPTRLSSGSRDNSSCKNWTNYAWKPTRTLESISRKKEFRVSQKVLLFNSHLKLTACKLRSRWEGPFVITNFFPYGAVELKDEHTNSTFQVNGHQIRLFHEGPTPTASDLETISLMEPAPPDGTH